MGKNHDAALHHAGKRVVTSSGFICGRPTSLLPLEKYVPVKKRSLEQQERYRLGAIAGWQKRRQA